ncbi:MAG: TatD family hydrolase [Crocinitomicaceae bacterium]|nr:TatD family hydrolase [Crocinitomicaceae bacterium]
MLIDTHSHLYAKEFQNDFLEVLDRAKENKVAKILLPNIDMDSISLMEDICQKHPDMFYPMMGLHPCSINNDWESQFAPIEKLLREKPYIALGEIGIDLYWDKTFLEEQKKAFSVQLKLANELNLPVVIHARDSFTEIFEVLDTLNLKKLSGVFHCFTGRLQEVEKINSYTNFYFGIGGVLTYKNSGLSDVLKHIPLNKLILETDSPYLPPVPYRGKRNESSYIVHVAQKVSEVLDIPLLEIEKLTTKNAAELFNLSL